MAEHGNNEKDWGAEQVEVLRMIWGEMKALNNRIERVEGGLNARLDALKTETHEGFSRLDARLDHTNERLDALAVGTEKGLSELSKRLDNVLLGEHRTEHREMRDRVVRLEERTGIGAPPRGP